MAKIDTTVGQLVDMIQRGELQLPEMQRRFVWTSTRVRDLLDSLYSGYLSGTILVWETELAQPTRDLAVAQQESPFDLGVVWRAARPETRRPPARAATPGCLCRVVA